jgi:ADP-ribose pyrophosphatase YjhB (NUDIX family)
MAKIIIASGPVIVEDRKVLLNKHGDDSFWKFCGGRVEDFETDLVDNAKREVKEEMGIEIEITNPEPFILHVHKDDKDIILVHYLAERIGEIVPGVDIREWKWMDVTNLSNDIGPNIKPTLTHFGFIK